MFINVCVCVPFLSEGGVWNLIVLLPDHGLSLA